VEGGAGRAWSWSSWHRPGRGRLEAHRQGMGRHTHNTLCNKVLGRGMVWAGEGTRHNNLHKQLEFFPINPRNPIKLRLIKFQFTKFTCQAG